MNPTHLLKPLDEEDFDAIIELGNKVHGDGYLDWSMMSKILDRSVLNSYNSSFALYDTSCSPALLIGFRLTYAPNQWQLDKWCTPEDWPIEQKYVAYFKCNTIHPSYQGKGLGGLLLNASISTLQKMGAKGGLSHIWMQSPGNASFKYFTKAGGTLIKTHPRRWYEDESIPNYVCVICGKECFCDASEMILKF